MKLFAAFQPNIWIFSITLCGYGIISFAVSDSQISQAITIPYRSVILTANIVLLLINLGIINSPHKNLSIVAVGERASQKFITILLAVFVLSYSVRMLYDIFVRNDVTLQQGPSQFILFWFFITLIPGINFLFLDKTKSEKYLLATWLLHCMIGIFAVTMNPSRGGEFFADQNRLANAALNPITMGIYGSSLYLLSLYMWLKKKQLVKSSIDKKLSFIYLFAALLGLTVAFLAGSRGPIIGGCVLSLLVVFYSGRINFKNIFGSVFLVAAINIIFQLIGRESSFFNRILSAEDEFNSTRTGRGGLIDTAVNVISNNLFTGVGITLPDGGYPHNIILESFLPFGLAGGVIFTWIWGYALLKSFKFLVDSNGEWGWLGLLFIQYAIAGVSSGSLYASSTFWYLLFAILGLEHKNLLISKVTNRGHINDKI